MKTKTELMYETMRPWKLFFIVALPGMISMFAMSVYSVVEGIFIGLIGAGAAIGLIMGGYSLVIGMVDSLGIAFVTMKPLDELLNTILASSLGLGAILGGIGSFISGTPS